MANSKILTAEQEKHCVSRLRNMSENTKEIDELRKDGTAKVIMYQSRIENVKRDKTLSKGEKILRLHPARRSLNRQKR